MIKKKKPKQGTRGTTHTRRMQRQLSQHIFRLISDLSVNDAADVSGLSENDIRNLRQGNMPSLRILIRLVKKTRLDPASLLVKGEPKNLPDKTSLRGAQLKSIASRVRKIVKAASADELAGETGLSIHTIYQQRVASTAVGIHVFLALVHSGHSAREMLLG